MLQLIAPGPHNSLAYNAGFGLPGMVLVPDLICIVFLMNCFHTTTYRCRISSTAYVSACECVRARVTMFIKQHIAFRQFR
jgi:hypothetical protein